MKINLIAVLLVWLGITLFSFGQTDIWTPVIQDGFSIPSQKTVPEMEVYKDTLYIATAPLTAAIPAKLWRSGNGIDSWEDVTPAQFNDNSIHSFCKSNLDGGYFWFGTGSNGNGAAIYQSRNGTDWKRISQPGFGTPELIGSAPNMVVFKGPSDTTHYLYAGAGSHGLKTPAEVWRIPYNSSNTAAWEKIIDFDTVPTSISDTVDLISYFEVWNNKIYFGTNAKGQLWESTDGINFKQNTGVGYGFAATTPGNIVISAIEIFNDTMYLTTTNFSGGQLWRTGDGITFEAITKDAFGEGAAVNELRKPVIGNGKLWITGYTETTLSSGTPIWSSVDGKNWTQSNSNGFGDTLNNGKNPSLVAFNNHMYFGGPNYTQGGQVRRTSIATNTDNINKSNCKVLFYPNPVTDFGTIKIDNKCSDISKVSVYNIQGKFVKNIPISPKKTTIIRKADFLPGIYLYSVTYSNNTTSRGKFLVQ